MRAIEISKQHDPVIIRHTPAGESDNPFAFDFGPPDNNGWRHFVFQLNYVADNGDITLESGCRFRVHGELSLPRDAENLGGQFASIMYRIHQAKDQEVCQMKSQTTQKYEWLLKGVVEALRTISYPPSSNDRI